MSHAIGKSVARIDGWQKVSGEARYADDFSEPGMLWAGCVFSKYPHANASVDASTAKELPGVACVLTEEDFPKPFSMIDCFYCTSHPRYVGDVVAVVAAETPQELEDALGAVRVRYERTDGTYSIKDALVSPTCICEGDVATDDQGLPQDGTCGNVIPSSYYVIRKGSVEKGFCLSEAIVEGAFDTQYIDHAYIEPESVIVSPDPDVYGGVIARTCCQNPHDVRTVVADALQIPHNRVRSIQATVGGSFGGKTEGVELMAGRAALVVVRTGRPCKMTLTREDSMRQSTKRHPFHIETRIGATRDGRICALRSKQVANGGAYDCDAPFMNIRARVHSAGPYAIDNICTDTYTVHTDGPMSGAMRGYSSPQIIFANELAVDELADELGMSVVDVKRRNLLRRGDKTATGQVLVHETLLAAMMEDIVSDTRYLQKDAEYRRQTNAWWMAEGSGGRGCRVLRGVGLVTSYRGVAWGGESVDATGTTIMAMPDGTLIVRVSLAENGQGLRTAYGQIASEATGIPLEDVVVEAVDSSASPDCGETVASRGTAQGGQSVRRAGEAMRSLLLETARSMLGLAPGAAIGQDGSSFFAEQDPSRRVTAAEICSKRKAEGDSLTVFRWYRPRPLITDQRTGQGDAFTTYAYGACVAEVEVNMHTGQVRVRRVTSYHDVGKAINPSLVKGQIYGGIAMGIGFGLTEQIRMDKGQMGDLNFDSYELPTTADAPEMVVRLYECADEEGTYGAKCIGEAGTEMVGAAVALAVKHATGTAVRRLPLTPAEVLRLVTERRKGLCVGGGVSCASERLKSA